MVGPGAGALHRPLHWLHWCPLEGCDFAWVAVVSAWAIAVVQCMQAFLQLAHLRLSLPLSAFVLVAYAIGMTRLLRPRPSEAGVGRGIV